MSNPAPRVSVLLPVYNAVEYLGPTLDSLLSQTFTDFEIVAIDDASPQDCVSVLNQYAARDARLRVIVHPVNQGLVATLNHAIAEARGEYLARQDGDDLSPPDRFARQVALLDAQPQVGLVSGAVQIIDAAGQPLDLPLFTTTLSNAGLQQELLSLNPICHGSVMLRRSVLAQVGGYTPELETTEDYDLWLRVAEVAELARVPEVVYVYRHHTASLSHKRRAHQHLQQARTLERAIRRRHGPQPSAAAFRPAALTYLAAAEHRLAQADWPGLAELVGHALALCPTLADEPDTYLPLPPGPDGVAVLTTAFQQLPPTPQNHQRLRRWLARRHMQAAFSAARHGDRAAAAADIRAALRYDARWLRNRGVLVLLARGLLAPHRPPPGRPQGDRS